MGIGEMKIFTNLNLHVPYFKFDCACFFMNYLFFNIKIHTQWVCKKCIHKWIMFLKFMEKVKRPNLPLWLWNVFHHSQRQGKDFLANKFSFYILGQTNFKPNMDLPKKQNKNPFNFLNENVNLINWVTNSQGKCETFQSTFKWVSKIRLK
jgi:hypothetical protein